MAYSDEQIWDGLAIGERNDLRVAIVEQKLRSKERELARANAEIAKLRRQLVRACDAGEVAMETLTRMTRIAFESMADFPELPQDEVGGPDATDCG